MTRIEVLYFQGCPNHAAATAMVERIVDEIIPGTAVETVEVATDHEVERLRFLGSPTVRVDGHDVQPGADERTDFQMTCRIYQSEKGLGSA